MYTKTPTKLFLALSLLCAGACSHDDAGNEVPPDSGPDRIDAGVDAMDEGSVCPADYPVLCEAAGSFGDECWSEDTDCSTRKVCPDGHEYACSEGYTVDCATVTCKPVDGGGGTPTPTIPAWLIGSYYRTGKQENNIYFTSDDRSLGFSANGTYRQQIGNAAETTGKFSVANNTVTFLDGALGGQALSLGNIDSTCRVLGGFGSPLWRHSEVNGCPTATRVAPADCANVGTFKKVTHSGDIGSSGSGSESDYTETVTLSRDKFYTINQDRYSTTCFQFNCKSLSNRIQTLVGQWSPATGAFTYTLAQLHSAGWSFVRSTASCP